MAGSPRTTNISSACPATCGSRVSCLPAMDLISIKVLRGIGAIKQADAHRAERSRLEVAGVHAHVVRLARPYALPVHDAAAGRAAHEPQRLASPGVRLRCVWP